MSRNLVVAWAILALLVLTALLRYETFVQDGNTYRFDRIAGGTWRIAVTGEFPLTFNGTAEAITLRRNVVSLVLYGSIAATGVYIFTKSRRRTDETEAQSS